MAGETHPRRRRHRAAAAHLHGQADAGGLQVVQRRRRPRGLEHRCAPTRSTSSCSTSSCRACAASRRSRRSSRDPRTKDVPVIILTQPRSGRRHPARPRHGRRRLPHQERGEAGRRLRQDPRDARRSRRTAWSTTRGYHAASCATARATPTGFVDRRAACRGASGAPRARSSCSSSWSRSRDRPGWYDAHFVCPSCPRRVRRASDASPARLSRCRRASCYTTRLYNHARPPTLEPVPRPMTLETVALTMRG